MYQQGNVFGISQVVNVRSRHTTRIGLAFSKVVRLVGFGIAGIFFWLAILKLTGVSPIVELLRHSVPFLAEYPYIQLLAMAEVLIGLGLVIDKLSHPASALMILTIASILGIVLLAPAMVFEPASRELTIHGSFLANYVIFTLAGLLFLSWRQRRAGVRGQGSGIRARW